MKSQPGEGRLDSLQALRGIAAFMVAASHLYGVDQRFFGGPVLSPVIQVGFSGVDLFFVLSGFVMVFLTRFGIGHKAVVPAFMFARVARIYPLWWLMLGVVSVVWLIRPTIFVSVPNLQADIFLWPHQNSPFLAVGWTLIHEMYFYLAFGLLLFLPSRYFVQGLLGWLMVVAMGNALCEVRNISPTVLLKLLIHPLTLEFGLGAAVGLLATRGYRPEPLLLLSAGITWLVAAYLFSLDQPTFLFDRAWARVTAFGPAWALIMWGMVGLEADKGICPPRSLVSLGDASYALYLVHVPIYGALSRICAPLFNPDPWDNILAWLVLLAFAIITAVVAHHLIERPLHSRLTRLRYRLMPIGSSLMPSPPLPLTPKKS